MDSDLFFFLSWVLLYLKDKIKMIWLLPFTKRLNKMTLNTIILRNMFQ